MAVRAVRVMCFRLSEAVRSYASPFLMWGQSPSLAMVAQSEDTRACLARARSGHSMIIIVPVGVPPPRPLESRPEKHLVLPLPPPSAASLSPSPAPPTPVCGLRSAGPPSPPARPGWDPPSWPVPGVGAIGRVRQEGPSSVPGAGGLKETGAGGWGMGRTEAQDTER